MLGETRMRRSITPDPERQRQQHRDQRKAADRRQQRNARAAHGDGDIVERRLDRRQPATRCNATIAQMLPAMMFSQALAGA